MRGANEVRDGDRKPRLSSRGAQTAQHVGPRAMLEVFAADMIEWGPHGWRQAIRKRIPAASLC